MRLPAEECVAGQFAELIQGVRSGAQHTRWLSLKCRAPQIDRLGSQRLIRYRCLQGVPQIRIQFSRLRRAFEAVRPIARRSSQQYGRLRIQLGSGMIRSLTNLMTRGS